MPKAVTETDDWPIQPKDIVIPEKSGSPFLEAFGCYEMEVDASRIVRFCQDRGGWVAFTAEEMRAYSLKKERTTRLGVFDFGHHTPPVGRAVSLIVGGFVERDGEGGWRVTDVFIERCYKASRGEKIEPLELQQEPQPEPPSVPASRKVVPGIWRHSFGNIVEVLGVAGRQDAADRFVIYRPPARDPRGNLVDPNFWALPEAKFLQQFFFVAPLIE